MASILDTGNLVLVNRTNDVVWQSFDSPKDTLLPNQSYIANSSVTMKAWRAYGDWRDSIYSLNWSTLSTLSAYWLSNYSLTTPLNFSYWSFPTPSSSAFLTVQGEFLSTSEDFKNKTVIGASQSGVGVPNRLLRVTLDIDGNLRMYSWSNGSSNWEVEWEAIDDVCTIFGYCGPFAICSIGECTCPEGFQFVNATDPKQGCVRTKLESTLCGINTMISLECTDYLYSGDSTLYENILVEDCTQNCLSDCDCQAASVFLSDTGIAGECWLRRNILLNGQYIINRTTYLRTVIPSHRPASRLSESSILKLVASTLGATTAVLGILSCTFCGFFLYRKIKNSRYLKLQKKWVPGKDAVTIKFTFEEIQFITNNFSMEIGRGGFGTVFKGQMGYHKNHTDVAVKRLDKLANSREQEFVNEVDIIGQIHHVHLVHLLGYCAEAEHRILVYEYVSEGSLDRVLFQGDIPTFPVLEWRSRFKIAIQTARALAYLHDDCSQRIIHCDVKPENILLDSAYCAKVADFGISRIMNREQTQTITMQVRGTRGYLAPEWTNHQIPITAKTDVFSYGMLLLELISGRQNLKTSSTDVDAKDLYFPIWAYPYIDTTAFMDVLDPLLTRLANPVEVQRALLVAFWCINDKPHLRPSMVQIIQMLKGHVPIEVPVPRPDFFDHLLMDGDEIRPIDFGISS